MSQNKSPNIFYSTQVALLSLFERGVFVRLLIPLVVAFGLLLVMVFFFWSDLKLGLQDYFLSKQIVITVMQSIADTVKVEVSTMMGFFAISILVFFFAFFLYVLTLVLTSLLLIPILLPLFQQKYFPALKKKPGISLVKSSVENIKAVIIYAIIFLVMLPFFYFPLIPLLTPWLLNAFTSRRVFLVDVLQDYGTEEEYKKIKKEKASGLLQLGLLSGLFFYVPILNFLAPQIMAMAYIHYVLGLLEQERATVRL